jgi:hypothetical protein
METTSEKSGGASTQSAPPSKCDIVYLAKGRPEFTAASLAALARNTNWERVEFLWIYTDGERADVMLYRYLFPGMLINLMPDKVGGPVAVMNDYLTTRFHGSPLWAKIDNDVIAPPGWLDACLDVMDAHPELDLLGIEPPESRTPAPWAGGKRVPAPEKFAHPATISNYAPCDSIGGIGLFRTSAWRNRPAMIPHSTYGGFGDWAKRTNCVCGWLVPPLKLFLLDRLPVEPWASLSKRYIAEKQQRAWTMYSQAEAESLAGWWLRDNIAK